jgi:hypothetical protein
MDTLRRSVCMVLPALLGGAAAPAAADDAQHHAQIIERLAPQDRQAYIERLIEQRQAEAAADLTADVTGPVLTAFNAPTKLNVSNPAAPFKVATKATDNLSGVTSMIFYAVGPSGQTFYAQANANFPLTAVALSGGVTSLNRMAEPGVWHFNYGYGYDGAGNYAYFSQAALEALGNTSFTVVNNGGYDTVGPALTGGKILTPSVSLSSFLPGTTDKPRSVGVKVTVTDTGNTALAGPKQVSMYFCKLAQPDVCFYPYGYFYATGQSTATFNAGTQVSASSGNVTGTYELRTVYVADHAGSYTYLYGTAFGGTTDFSALFPGGTSIKLKP